MTHKQNKKTSTLFEQLKGLSAVVGIMSTIVIPSFLLYQWNTAVVIKTHNKELVVNKNVTSIKGINKNLVVLDKKNKEEHNNLQNGINDIKDTVKSIDNRFNLLLLQQKYRPTEKVNNKNKKAVANRSNR